MLINAANSTIQTLYSTPGYPNIDQFSPPPTLTLSNYQLSALYEIEWESGDTFRFLDGSLIMRVTFNSTDYFDASTAHMTTLAGTASSPYGHHEQHLSQQLGAKRLSTSFGSSQLRL